MSKIKMVHKCYWFLCVYTDLFCFFFGVKGYKTEDFSAQYTAVSGKPGMSRCGWRLCHRGWRRFAINWNKEKVTNHQMVNNIQMFMGLPNIAWNVWDIITLTWTPYNLKCKTVMLP